MKNKQEINFPTPQDAQEAILSPITKALTKHGITLDQTCQKLKESMEAKETKVFNNSGELIYSDDLIAHGIRLKAVIEALKLQQAYPAEKQELEITGVQLLAPAVKKPKSAGK